MTTTYISTNDTAKMIRKTLKNHFPLVKFSVRSDKYSGGSSINVSYTDGPFVREVEAVVKFYEGAKFDGMTDCKDYQTALMVLEGDEMPTEVNFGADYVFVNRKTSAEYDAELVKVFEYISGEKYEAEKSYSTDAFGYYQMPTMYGCQILRRMSYDFAPKIKVGA